MTTTPLQATVPMQPGTRFVALDPGLPLASSELVVNRTVRDDLGMLHVVLTDLEDREISLFAEQFEAAVVSGMLSAVTEPIRVYA